jgi:hypothetical protein
MAEQNNNFIGAGAGSSPHVVKLTDLNSDVAYNAGKFIADFVTWKTIHWFDKTETVERVVERIWFKLYKQLDHVKNVEIPSLLKDKKLRQEAIKSNQEKLAKTPREGTHRIMYDYFNSMISSDKNWIKWLDYEILDRSRRVMSDISGLEKNYPIGKHIQRDKIKLIKQELFAKAFHPKRVEYWLMSGKKLEDGEHDFNVVDMMFGCD